MEHMECKKIDQRFSAWFQIRKIMYNQSSHFWKEPTKIIDEEGCADIIYLDFCKAFNKVPQHQRFLSMLQMHGIDIYIRNWIGNWLHNRKQRVVVDGVKSEWFSIMSGVPQGSVLGPALLIVYINDVDANVSSSVPKFADDTKLHSNVWTCDWTDHLQCASNKMSEWSTKWQMLFNADKCKCLHEGHSYPSANDSIIGVEIKNV